MRRLRGQGIVSAPHAGVAPGGFERLFFGAAAFLFGGFFGFDPLFFQTRGFLGRRLGLEGGAIASLGRFEIRIGGSVRGCGGGPKTVAPGCRPTADGKDAVRNLPEPDAGDDRNRHDDQHEDRSAEVGDEGNQTSGHEQIPEPTSGILDVKVPDDVRDYAGVCAEDLQEAGGGNEKRKSPQAASGENPRAADEPYGGENAEKGNDPNGKTERCVTVVGKKVSERANPVCRLGGRHVQRRNCTPVVCQQGDQRKQGRENRHPGQDSLAGIEIGVSGRRADHCECRCGRFRP